MSARPALLALVAALLATTAHAAPQIAFAEIPPIVASHQAAYVAPPAADTVLHLVISMPMQHEDELRALVRAITDPASPQFRHYLSVADFTARFGTSEADYAAAAAFFQAQGLTVAKTTPNRYLIDVDGRVADIERVFHVTLGLYRHPTENRLFLAPDRVPTLDLATQVQEVIGLDDYELPHPKLIRGPARQKHPSGSGPSGYYTGSDMHAIYYPTGTLTGAGQSVGLMELEGYNIADVTNFFAQGYGPANSVNVVGIKTDSLPVMCTHCDDGEQALDIEYSISIAPGLDSVRVYVGKSPQNVLNAMATDNISKSLSTSWGWTKHFKTDDRIFLEFAAQGQTNLTASGDYSTLKASGPWPEEDANIVAVGGTDVESKTPGGPWSSETGWSGSAGGPSLDPHIKIESYQLPFITAANGGSTTLRNVPDVAANADTDMIICADGGCPGGYGGTSFASPMWAGIVALANQQAVAAGKPVVGFINPAIYALGGGSGYSAAFHDETKGKSGIYSCTKSFDLVTGLGSPDGQGFIDALVNQ
jgi:subtilase family serine protease